MPSLHPVGLSTPFWDSPICPTPLAVDDVSYSSHALIDPFGHMQPTSPIMRSESVADKPFEELMYEVLSHLIREEEKATLILRDAVFVEKQWQKDLMERLEKEHAVCYTHEQQNNFARIASDVIIPLSLVAGGIIALYTGGVALLPLGAAALGGLMALETVLDSPAKKTLASWLGRGSDEDTKAWFERICMVTSLTMFGLGMCIPGNQAVSLATSTSQCTVECTLAGTESLLNNQKARLIEHEKQWDDSGRCLKELLGDVERQVKSVDSIFTMIADLQKSTMQASAQIFQKV